MFAESGRYLRLGLDLLLPPRCLACGSEVAKAGSLCAACWGALAFIVPPQCRACGYPLPHAMPDAPLCGACAAEPPVFERARAALCYDDGSKRLILAFKHADRTDIGPLLGPWLNKAGAELLSSADLIAPVPLHRWRLLKRGYNQAAVLARGIARSSGVSMVPDLLVKIRATASQQALGARARQENLSERAFRVHPWHRQRVRERRVLLMDDVLTTGATVTACARALLKAGAAGVDVLTLARVTQGAFHPISQEDDAARQHGAAPQHGMEGTPADGRGRDLHDAALPLLLAGQAPAAGGGGDVQGDRPVAGARQAR